MSKCQSAFDIHIETFGELIDGNCGEGQNIRHVPCIGDEDIHGLNLFLVNVKAALTAFWSEMSAVSARTVTPRYRSSMIFFVERRVASVRPMMAIFTAPDCKSIDEMLIEYAPSFGSLPHS